MRPSSRGILLALLAIVSLAMLGALVLVGEGAGEFFALLAVAFPVLLVALGVRQKRGSEGRTPGSVGTALVALFILLELSAGILLLLRGRVLDGPWIFGLPAAVVVQLVGFWLGPLLLVGLAYALTFDSQGLREEDLNRLRQRWGGRRGESEG